MAKLTGTNPDQVPTNADLGTMAYQDKDNVKVGSFTSNGIDDNATSTAMTLDSSGNLLVATTTGVNVASGTDDGFTTRTDGRTDISRPNGQPLNLRRRGDDGRVVTFYKDTTEVGNIKTNLNKLEIESSSALLFSPSNSNVMNVDTVRLYPTSDAGLDLGLSSNRFKDLYLSGGVYLGGTGSANYLDDYEEGTWTPTLESNGQVGSFTYSLQAGFYTKIGRLVHVSCSISWASKPSTGGTFRVSGLPFAYSALTYANNVGVSVGYSDGIPNTDGLYGRMAATGGGSRTAVGWYSDGSTIINVTTGNNISSSGTIRFSLMYFT